MPTSLEPATPPSGPGFSEYAIPLALGGLSYYGQQQTNASNASIAREQMAFQERMRGTQWQTTVADMKKAGINPALAYSQGGAGTPGGASAVMQNSAAAGANSASAAAANLAAVRAAGAQIEKTHAEAEGQRIQNEREAIINEYQYKAAVDPEGKGKGTIGGLTPFVIWQQRRQLESQIAQATSATEVARLQAQLQELDLPERRATAGLYEKFGKYSWMIPGASKAAQTFGDFIPRLKLDLTARKR